MVAPSPSSASLNWMGECGARTPSSSRELGLALDQRAGAEVRPVKVQQVEGEEDQPVRLGMDGMAERVEIGAAVIGLHDEFAVEDGGAAAQPLRFLDDRRIERGPVVAASGEGARLAVLHDQQRAVAVVLDLVQPAVAGGRLLHQGGDQRLDEGEAHVPARLALIDLHGVEMIDGVDQRAGIADAEVGELRRHLVGSGAGQDQRRRCGGLRCWI